MRLFSMISGSGGGGGGTGDVVGPASSVDGEIVLFNGTTGKSIKSATGTGVVHATSGVFSVASVSLTSEVTGVLPVANGGTNSSTALNSNRFVISSGGKIVEATAVTSGRIVYGDSNGLPTFTGLGVSTAFGANDPIIYAQNSLNFRVAGSSGVDAMGLGSAGDVLFTATGRRFGPDAAGTNIDMGSTGARVRDAYLKGALFITAGANQICGTATLSGGTVTVNNTRVTASSLIFAMHNAPGGTIGILSVDSSKIVASTSFVIDSSNAADTSTVRWFFIN